MTQEESKKIDQLQSWKESGIYSIREQIALEYAETITITGRNVTEDLQARLLQHFKKKEIIELTAIVAFQNLSSKFNSALNIKSNGFCDINKTK